MTRPPNGWKPPDTAPGPDGSDVDLAGPATRACEAYVAEDPAYVERYGSAALPWCIYDLQHVLNWALTRSAAGLEGQLDWLTRVLAGRDFSLESLARGIELLATEVRPVDPGLAEIAARLDAGAARVRLGPQA